MEQQLKIIGILLIALAFLHLFFPRYFNWKEELKRLSLINKQMMVIHTFFIALTVFLMGLLCLIFSKDLLFTSLGRALSIGLGTFWLVRLFIQFFGYTPKLWKGKKFETTIHILFTFLWLYFSIVFLWVGVS